jgi:D-alanine-D-alanine ligase
VLGTHTRAEILPIVELDFGNWDPQQPKVSDREVKFGPESEGSPKLRIATGITADLQARIERAALLAYRALRISDYARVDLRVSGKTNEPFVLEINPNPYLENQSELAMAARERGLSYTQLIGRIVESACSRYQLKLTTKAEKPVTGEVPTPPSGS